MIGRAEVDKLLKLRAAGPSLLSLYGHDQRIAAEFLREPPDGRTVTGLSACLAAAGQHAIQLLLVSAGGLVPGYACQRCGALSSTGDGCPHGAPESLAVPDLIEELAVATLGDGGQVETLCDPPGGIAARLRYAQPLPLWVTRSFGLDGAAWPAACTCCAADVPHRCVRVAGARRRWSPCSPPLLSASSCYARASWPMPCSDGGGWPPGTGTGRQPNRSGPRATESLLTR